MQTNRRLSIVLLGATLALLYGCERKGAERTAAAPDAEPQALAKATSAGAGDAPACPPTVDNLVGPTWTVDDTGCDVGCEHAHLEVGNTITFSKTGDAFDVHGRYETSGGALTPIPGANGQVRGILPGAHEGGDEHGDHWMVARIYLPSNDRCATPTPYDVQIAFCKAEPDSFDGCKPNDQHGGYGHSHP
jgi:hypothetical protein